jgi:protein SCO1
MPAENKFPVVLIVGVLTSFVLGIVALVIITTADKSRIELPVLGQVPQFEFVKQDGAPFGLNNMLGKPNVVDFMFTSCLSACPTMNSNMADLYRQFSGTDKVQFVSITVDPDRDSLSVLRQYAHAFGVNDDRWVFLWQPVSDVAQLSEKGFMLAADELPAGHSRKLVLVDEKGQIRGYYDGMSDTDTKLLARDITALVRAIK